MALLMTGSILLGLFLAWIITKPYLSPLRHIPGPRYYPVVGSLLSLNLDKYHQHLLDFHKRYGPVVRVVLPHAEMVVVSGYEAVRKVLITSGMEFAGRFTTFRTDYFSKRTGIPMSPPDATWKSLRNISQKHLKQFGDGLSRIGEVAALNGRCMFETFRNAHREPLDPNDHIFNATLITIGYLIIGAQYKPGDPFIEKIRKMEWGLSEYVPSSKFKYVIYDLLPWLRHLRLRSWCDIENLNSLVDDIWSDLEDLVDKCPDKMSLTHTLLTHIDERKNANKALDGISRTDAKITIMSLLFAGVTTTSATFYGCVNILAHKQTIQQKIFDEIASICDDGKTVTLGDRNKMPYTRAFILELHRYVSITPIGVPHVALIDEVINGMFIPRGTLIHINLWGLHHDPEFWTNPSEFDPERFLDENGQLVAVDHPNRQHLMPFGAGPRVCLAEAMASARLFVWVSMLVQQFKVVPSDDNTPENIDVSRFIMQAVMRIPRYRVVFQPRDDLH